MGYGRYKREAPASVLKKINFLYGNIVSEFNRE